MWDSFPFCGLKIQGGEVGYKRMCIRPYFYPANKSKAVAPKQTRLICSNIVNSHLPQFFLGRRGSQKLN